MNNSTIFLSSKKLTIFTLLFLLTGFFSASFSYAQSAGFNTTYIVLNISGGGNAYYDLQATTGNPDFNGANLGTFCEGNTTDLIFKGAEHNVYKCGGCDLTSTRLYYRIYPTGSPSGSYVSNTIGYTSGFNNGCSGQDQQWSNTGFNTNLLSGLTSGNYTIEVYSDATITCSGGTAFASNGGANYKATFTVNATTVGGSVTGGTGICSGSTSGLLTLAGNNGSVVRWESSVSPFSSWSTIANTLSTYTSGTLTQTTKFRAVVKNGVCAEAASADTTVSIETTTWTSAGGGSWDNGAPTTGAKAAIISANYSQSANINACSLTINNSAVVSIPSTFNVTLSGGITVSSGSFTLENNANLIQTTSAANSGNIIVKRNSNPLIRLDYTLWSSPVASQQLLAFSPLTSINPTVRFYTYNTTTNQYNSVASPSTTNFATGIGYLIRVPFNHPTAPTTWTGSFTGVPNNGTYNISLNNVGVGQRFNAIGNPYPSTVSLAQFATDNSANIEPTLYYWRKTNNTASPSYCTWNTTSNTFGDNGEAYTDSPLGILQTGQGFIVEAKPAATSVQFNNNQRTANNANQFFRTPSEIAAVTPPEAHRIWLNLTGGVAEFSQAVVGYFTNATQGADDFDSKFFNDGQIMLNSIVGSTEYVIQGRAVPFQATDIVPLNYRVNTAGNYTFTIDHVDGLFTGGAQNIFIKDNLNGTYNNLNTSPYTFASTAGTFASRFELVYQTVLGTPQHAFTNSDVIAYPQNNELVVNSSNITIKAIKVFDVRGRLLTEKTNINATETQLNVVAANQVLILQITSTEGDVVIKKVVN